jgi:hypothetical protein
MDVTSLNTQIDIAYSHKTFEFFGQ